MPCRLAGASRYLTNLIRYLAREDPRNEYFLFLKKRDLRLLGDLPANFHPVLLRNYSRPARLAWESLCPARYARKLNLDLWHAPHYVVPRGLDGCRLVVTFHDLTFFLFPHLYEPVRRWTFQHAIRQAVSRADTIISVSRTTQQDLLQLFPETNGRTVTIYSGVDGRFFQPQPHADPREEGNRYSGGAPYVLFVGTLERRKNVPTLIAAYARLIRTSHLPHHLVIAGQPENDFAAIRRAIIEHNLGSRVHLPGYVPEDDLAALYAAADLFICPSRYEGFAFPILEAMAMGTPALCATAGATAEVAQLPVRFFSPDDTAELAALMHRSLTDEGLRQRLVDHGRQRASEFLWEQTAAATIAAYNRTAEMSNSHAAVPPPTPPHERRHRTPVPNSEPALPFDLEVALLRTLAFSDLFDYPLTLEEVHRSLVCHRATRPEVQRTLADAVRRGRVAHQDGHYFLPGRDHLVVLRHLRQKKAQALLRRHRRLLQGVCSFPFVRAVALSGALAFENANGHDDIDLFLIVDGRRTWSTYVGLVLLTKALRKRRMMCINCVESTDAPAVPEQSFFVAHQIAHLRPLSGNSTLSRFWAANRWLHDFLPQAQPLGPTVIGDLTRPTFPVQRLAEKLLGGPLFDRLEKWVFAAYGRRIRRLARHLGSGVAIERRRIKLFTHDHLPTIMNRYQQRLEQLGCKDGAQL